MPNICAVVLTFNRKDLLEECLAAILAQTRACTRVLVVDNASTDGTFEMLEDRWAGRVEVHRLPVNIGAAGGFNRGMRLGHLSGADFLWVMDDDVIPEPDALEKLVEARASLAERAIDPPFLLSVARSPKGIVTNTPDIDRARNALSYADWPALLGEGLVAVQRATFVSILLPRATLDRFGLPIADMFIWGEDTEFTVRVTRQQPGYIVGRSAVTHVRQLDGRLDIRTETNPARIGYHHHYIRNQIYTFRTYYSRRSTMRLVWEKVRTALGLARRGEFRKAGIVARATLAGLSFEPAVEQAGASFDRTGMRILSVEEGQAFAQNAA
ncbi:glycosyltransferase family 2 protein [Sphingomonas naphthae]|uniref:Glycosyltransferase family 2 protein n=1 Tax=Sphingomonas naphthae TaxID=1813468 RepID=A0ABY7TG37_9SPHN|nr:glycosyltransferase family 2 protein [Sphingomonas naphthae]WCT71895.1 glycosyltransferase family 2 protein [Sphingomonas naphthae]